jgi:polar amino acid transport system substrate-binding protein
LLLTFALPASAATLTIRSDNWPPFNGDPKDAKSGYMIDVLREIFVPSGDKIDYQLMSWDESLERVRKGEFAAVVGASVDDAPDFVFPKESFGINGNSFFVKKGSPWKYTGIKSLEKVRLGIIESYSYEEAIDAYIKKNAKSSHIFAVSGEDALPALITLLQQGKIDAIVEDTSVMLYSLVNRGVPPGSIVKAGSTDDQVELYVAFSPKLKNAREYARRFDEGIAKLRQSGRLPAILSRYGLKDWK